MDFSTRVDLCYLDFERHVRSFKLPQTQVWFEQEGELWKDFIEHWYGVFLKEDWFLFAMTIEKEDLCFYQDLSVPTYADKKMAVIQCHEYIETMCSCIKLVKDLKEDDKSKIINEVVENCDLTPKKAQKIFSKFPCAIDWDFLNAIQDVLL